MVTVRSVHIWHRGGFGLIVGRNRGGQSDEALQFFTLLGQLARQDRRQSQGHHL